MLGNNRKQAVIFPLNKVEVKRQYKNIDILILIKHTNDRSFIILIEDKVGTGLHSDQLERYYKDNIGRIYILLRASQLSIELGLNNEFKGKDKSGIRREYRNLAYRTLKAQLNNKSDNALMHEFIKPSYFGNGQNMTLLVYEEYKVFNDQTNYIDVQATADALKKIAQMIKDLANSTIIDGDTIFEVNI